MYQRHPHRHHWGRRCTGGNDLPGYLGRHEMLRTFSPKVSVAAAPVSVLTPEDVKAVEYLVRQGRSLSDGADEALNGNT